MLLGFDWRIVRCSTATVGDRPVIVSKDGTLSAPNCVSENIRYLRLPSSYKVSNARLDLPLPETPVMTVSFSFGIVTSMFFKLWICAFLILIVLFFIFLPIMCLKI